MLQKKLYGEKSVSIKVWFCVGRNTCSALPNEYIAEDN